MEPEAQRQWAERAVYATHAVFPETVMATSWSLCQRYLSQAQTGATLIQECGFRFIEATSHLTRIANYLQDCAFYEQAEHLYLQALQVHEQAYDSKHPEMAQLLFRLSVLYYQRGKYEQAEPLAQRALFMWEQVLGPNHPNVARPLNTLAILSHRQGKYEQAESLYQRALAIREQALGPNHPEVARPLNNLANLYKQQGKYHQAEPLYQRSLNIREQAQGSGHPDVALALNNLGNLYKEQRNYAEAEPLYQRALRIYDTDVGMATFRHSRNTAQFRCISRSTRQLPGGNFPLSASSHHPRTGLWIGASKNSRNTQCLHAAFEEDGTCT